MADDVPLTDLEVIRRYSLAVRSATADREQLLAALRSDVAWLEGRGSGNRRTAPTSSSSRSAAKKTVQKAAGRGRRA